MLIKSVSAQDLTGPALLLEIEKLIVLLTADFGDAGAHLMIDQTIETSRMVSGRNPKLFISSFQLESYIAHSNELVVRLERALLRAIELNCLPADTKRVENAMTAFVHAANNLKRFYHDGPLDPRLQRRIERLCAHFRTIFPPRFELYNQLCTIAHLPTIEVDWSSLDL
jgi:hypothetical protein